MSTLSTVEQTKGFFGALTGWVLVLMTFSIPLFFLPWTASPLENNKQLLFVLLAVVGLVSWLGQMVLAKRVSFVSGWLNLIPGAYLIVILISSLTSLAGYQTWVGHSAQEHTSFITVSLLVLLFYLLLNRAGEMELQRRMFSALLLSSSIAGLLLLLGVFGVQVLPFDFAEAIGFNTVGTINSFAMFMSVVMFVGLSMWLVSQDGRDRVIPAGTWGMVLRGLILFTSAVALLILVALDFWVFWVVNIIGVTLLGVFAFVKTQEFPHPARFALPLLVLGLSVLFLFVRSPLALNLPVVVSPSYETSWTVTTQALTSSTNNLLFGTGPGTYLYDYLALKPAVVNESQFWQLRFDRAKSFFMTQLATTGVVGVGLWLALMIWVAVKALGRLLFERDHDEWKMTYVVFSGWVILFAQHLLYSSNFTLTFLLWLFTGLLAAQVLLSGWERDFEHSPKLGLATTFVFSVFAIGVLTSLFITGSRFAAETAFARAIELDGSSDSTIDEVIAELDTAVKFNRFSDVYQRNLSSAYLMKARILIANVSAEPTTEETQAIADTVSLAINAAAQATAIEPNYVSNWVVRGSIYRDVMSFASGAEDLAAQAFLNAISLEPINPIHRTNLGRVYLTVADRARALIDSDDPELSEQAAAQEAQLLATAAEAFVSAIEQKSDYLPAHYYLAATYERQGNLEQAAERLVALRNNNPMDIGIAFQLSQMLIRLEQYETAQVELERIVELYPEYSNALWYLASVHEQLGDLEGAIELIMRVVELNPENTLAQERLGELLRGIAPPALPEPIQDGQEGATDSTEG
jgi:tetratricopeptide (TPR) repeat protein